MLAVVCFYAVNNYIWLRLDAPFPTFHYYAFDFGRVMEFYNLFQKFDLSFLIDQIIKVHNLFFHALAVAFTALIFQKSYIAIILFNNILYFTIAIISIYSIAKKIFDKPTGLLAVAIFSLYPAVYGLSRFYVIEFAVMGMIPLCVLYLLNTEEFTNRKYSLLFGLALGWAMMIKYSAVTFIIGPLLYVLVKALIFRQRDKVTKLLPVILNIGLSAFAAAAVTGIKYFNFNNIKFYLSHPLLEVIPGQEWYKLNSLRVYTAGLFDQQLSLVFFFVLLFASPVFFFKVKRKIIIILFTWIIVPWLILVTMPNSYRSAHFIIPYLPAIALISAAGLTQALKRSKKLKAIIIVLILAIGIIQYYDFSFGLGFNLSNWKVKITKGWTIHNYILSENVCRRPESSKIYDEVILLFAKYSDKHDSKVLVLPPSVSYSYVQAQVWDCIAWLRDLPIVALDANRQFIDKVLERLEEVDFILCAGNKDIKDSSYLDHTLMRVRNLYRKELDNETLVKIDQFLAGDVKMFRENFYRRVSKFVLIETIPYKETCFRIYKKQR